jgi:hypothetical protein
MSVNFEHYIILGVDLKNLKESKDFINLPYMQKYAKYYGNDIDFDDAMKEDLKNIM